MAFGIHYLGPTPALALTGGEPKTGEKKPPGGEETALGNDHRAPSCEIPQVHLTHGRGKVKFTGAVIRLVAHPLSPSLLRAKSLYAAITAASCDALILFSRDFWLCVVLQNPSLQRAVAQKKIRSQEKN